MKIYEYFYKDIQPEKSLVALCDPYDALYFDIETTGLSRERNHIYLIGASYYTNEGLNIIQWFAENETEEPIVIYAFNEFISSYSYLINFNGKTFDIPFVQKRAAKHHIEMDLESLSNIDLYSYIKKYKKFLSLNDTKQKTVERFLGIERNDPYSGKELIDVYNRYSKYSYLKNRDELLNMLLLHNKEDVLYMHHISQILNYSELDAICFKYISYSINEYTDVYGNTKKELIIIGSHNLKYICNGFTSIKTIGNLNLALNIKNNNIIIRIPILEKSLNYYFPNYKDYYYLINENICILKSIASSVKKENRVNATKENCFITYNGDYLLYSNSKKCKNENDFKLFKQEYNGCISYIRLEDFDNADDGLKSTYGNQIISLFFE